ncbi:MAG: hydrogenase maturation nickel metallochaperone HypA [Gammaproteobacteria bacterium]|nr:hydrogenase maturation nickel metallochaperone HypA [Gammaproteobacteria bacterium]
MHELSVCNALISEVEQIARQKNAAVVTRIVLKVGPLSGIEPQLLLQAYPLAAAGTVAVDADLVIETADVVVHCSQCGKESRAAANRLLCAACGDFRTRVISGDEMILQRLELDGCQHESAARNGADTARVFGRQ